MLFPAPFSSGRNFSLAPEVFEIRQRSSWRFGIVARCCPPYVRGARQTESRILDRWGTCCIGSSAIRAVTCGVPNGYPLKTPSAASVSAPGGVCLAQARASLQELLILRTLREARWHLRCLPKTVMASVFEELAASGNKSGS
jgi:hypothetical protein